MLVTLPTPDPGPESDTENPAHKEPGGLCEDPIAIRLRLGSDAHVEHHGVIADNPGGGSVAGSSFDTPGQAGRPRRGAAAHPAVRRRPPAHWFHRWALIAGAVAGLATGILMLYQIPSLGPGGVITSAHFGGVNWPLAHLGLHTGVTLYVGLLALGGDRCRHAGVPLVRRSRGRGCHQ